MESRRSSSRNTPAGRAERSREKPSAPVQSRLRISAETGRWEEPKPATPIPSFAEHRGMERMGVLADQYPLGQNPPRSYTAKHKLSSFQPGRATPTQVATPTAVTEDEAVAPSPQAAREVSSVDVVTPSESPSPVIETRHQSTPPVFAKLAANAASEAVAVTNHTPWQQAPVRDMMGNFSPTPYAASHANEVSTLPSSPFSNHTPVPSTHTPQLNGRKIVNGTLHPHTLSRHVEAALRQADETNPDLAVGLRKLREDCDRDPVLWAVLDGILGHNQTREHQRIFRRYIKQGKRSYRQSLSSNTSVNASSTSKLITSNGRLTRTVAKPASDSGLFLPSPSPLNPSYQLNFPSTSKLTQPTFQPSTFIMATPRLNGNDDVGADAPSPVTESRQQDGSRESSVSSTLSSAPSAADLDAMALEIEGTETAGAKTRSRKPLVVSAGAARRPAPNKPKQAPKTASKKTKGPKKGSFFRGADFKNNSAASKQSDLEIAEAQKEADEWREKFRQDQSFSEDYSGIYYRNSNVKQRSRPRSAPKPIDEESDRRATIHGRSVLTQGRGECSVDGIRRNSELSATLPDRPSKKRSRYDSDTTEEDDDDSPPSSPGALLVPPPPGAARSTRSTSPRGLRKPPAKRVKSARVMISPNKPKDGSTNAAARSALQYDQDDLINTDGEENNDFCAACGENGRLLCCDSCPNSFHFKCLDPPMKSAPEGTWYCSKCKAQQDSHASEAQSHGVLGKAVGSIGTSNPHNYEMLDQAGSFYDGIKSKESGAYQEISLPRTQVHDKALYKFGKDVTPKQPIPLEPYRALTDRHGKTIICTQCQRASDGKRVIIPCDYCPKYYHLDCLSPPLADVPRRGPDGSEGGSWMCPGHDRFNILKPDSALKSRNPKKPVLVDARIPRGSRNDGRIEVVLDEDEPIDFIDYETRGKKLRVPQKTIIMDFIEKTRMDNDRAAHSQKLLDLESVGGVHFIQEEIREEIRAELQAEMEAARQLRAKTFREQQAVLNLQELANKSPNQYSQNIAEVTAQLVMEAPSNVVQMQESAEHDERAYLLNMQSLVQQRLAVLGPTPSIDQAMTHNTTVSADPSDSHPPPAANANTGSTPNIPIAIEPDILSDPPTITDPTHDTPMDMDSTNPTPTADTDQPTPLRPSSSPPTLRKSGRERRSTSRGLGSLLANGSSNANMNATNMNAANTNAANTHAVNMNAANTASPGTNRRSVSRGRVERQKEGGGGAAGLLKGKEGKGRDGGRERSRGVSLGRK